MLNYKIQFSPNFPKTLPS